MTAQEAYAHAAARLAGAGVASPQAEAWTLLEALTGLGRVELLGSRGDLTPEQERRLGEWLARRSLREPLQLITGRTWFYGLELACEGGVLVPRPETERLVEIALALVAGTPGPRLLDVGTGSGAIALALKRERPDALVMGSDVSGRALALARRNAGAHSLAVAFEASSLLTGERVAEFAKGAHLIVSNPPYLPEGDRAGAQPEVRWDPGGALYAGPDGLAVYRRLSAQAQGLLPAGSSLLVELDPRNVELAASEAMGWAAARVHEDLTGRKRFLELRR